MSARRGRAPRAAATGRAARVGAVHDGAAGRAEDAYSLTHTSPRPRAPATGWWLRGRGYPVRRMTPAQVPCVQGRYRRPELCQGCVRAGMELDRPSGRGRGVDRAQQPYGLHTVGDVDGGWPVVPQRVPRMSRHCARCPARPIAAGFCAPLASRGAVRVSVVWRGYAGQVPAGHLVVGRSIVPELVQRVRRAGSPGRTAVDETTTPMRPTNRSVATVVSSADITDGSCPSVADWAVTFDRGAEEPPEQVDVVHGLVHHRTAAALLPSSPRGARVVVVVAVPVDERLPEDRPAELARVQSALDVEVLGLQQALRHHRHQQPGLGGLPRDLLRGGHVQRQRASPPRRCGRRAEPPASAARGWVSARRAPPGRGRNG